MDKIYVPSCLLEERLATYFQAIDHAAAASDNQRRQLLEKDIQTLMDLMERVNLGKVVTADEVPPPLHFQPHPDLLDELSSRLADYHKALYFADIEVVGNPLSSGDPLTTKKTNARTQQIQNLQKGIQRVPEDPSATCQTCVEDNLADLHSLADQIGRTNGGPQPLSLLSSNCWASMSDTGAATTCQLGQVIASLAVGPDCGSSSHTCGQSSRASTTTQSVQRPAVDLSRTSQIS